MCLLFIFCLFYFFSTLKSVSIYLDRNQNCSSNCGSSTNAFQSLPWAMYVMDQIIEENPQYYTNYNYLSQSYSYRDNIIFQLAFNQTFLFDDYDINITRPCNVSDSDCLYRFFNHSSYPYPASIIFAGNSSSILMNSQRVVIYSNYSSCLTFQNIFFNFNENNSCSDCGLPTANYGFIMIWPFTINLSRYSENSLTTISFINCKIENWFVSNKINHTYSFFMGFFPTSPNFQPSSYFDNTINFTHYLLPPQIVFTNCFINTNELGEVFFSIQLGVIHFMTTNFYYNTNNIMYLFGVSDIWKSYCELIFSNVQFKYSPYIIKSAFHSLIILSDVLFLGDTHSQTSPFIFDNSTIVTISNLQVTGIEVAYLFNFSSSNTVTVQSMQIDNSIIHLSLFNFKNANQILVNSTVINNLITLEGFLFYFINNNNFTMLNVSFSHISTPYTYSITEASSLFYLSNYNIITFYNISFQIMKNIASICMADSNNNITFSFINLTYGDNNTYNTYGDFLFCSSNNVIIINSINILPSPSNNSFSLEYFITISFKVSLKSSILRANKLFTSCSLKFFFEPELKSASYNPKSLVNKPNTDKDSDVS